MQDLNLASSFIGFLTGNPNSICDFRVINDKEKGDYGKNIRGTLADVYTTLMQYNNAGYGVFITVNAFNDAPSKTLENIAYIRAHVADLDDTLSAQEAYQRACAEPCPPHLAVQTSPGKFHLYWLVEPYTGNDFYKEQQTKIYTLFGGDKNVVDATRVLRLPGFYHNKAAPTLVTCWGITNRPRYTAGEIQSWLQKVDLSATSNGLRVGLGDPDKAAPSMQWLTFALNMIDPNGLAREQWLATSAAFKQAGWSLASPDELLNIWQTWCARYSENNVAENLKLWGSLKDTRCGWSHFCRVTNVQAYINASASPTPPTMPVMPVMPAMPAAQGAPAPSAELGEILDKYGKQIWFKDCYFVESEGKIFSPKGRFMDSTKFNGTYGGKEFCLRSSGGKTTDEAWKAALRSTDWTIPKVDHCRFLPQKPSFEILEDDMGRKGLNTYIPVKIKAEQGDVSRWTDYLTRIFNSEEDIKIFNSYLAHCVKYPGWKIPWAVLLQSGEGIGKQMIGDIMKRACGEMYAYQPKAEELISGATRFNGWMSNKILIIVDEVRVGDRYDLMNGLKTIITDRRIAVERKGVDQAMEDNVANWIFFSNFKDAFPVGENERRYCIFYSKLQSAAQIAEAGLNKDYFDSMYNWLENGGYKHIAWWYLNYPIEKGSLPHRAPHTSSYEEVLRIGRSPLRVVLDEKIESGAKGFRGGYVSLTMFQKAIAESSIRSKPAEYTLRTILEQCGYFELGKTAAPVFGEDLTHPSVIYGKKGLTVEGYEGAQI